MPFHSNTGPGKVFTYDELKSCPLPDPAVVIDVRKTTSYDPPLAWHLTAELENLTARMRLQGVRRWRFLSECIACVTLDPQPPDGTIMAARFTLMRGNGAVQSFSRKDEMIEHVHREFVDLVRTNRIDAASDTDEPFTPDDLPKVELERSTVRVFFLADMADPDSLTNAVAYADLLRKKSAEHDTSSRSGREDRIRLIIICLNSDSLHAHSTEHGQRASASTVLPSRKVVFQEGELDPLPAYQTTARYNDLLASPITKTFDTTILLYAYRDDEGFVDNNAQLNIVELLLPSLLLAPDTLARLNPTDQSDLYLTHYDLDEDEEHLVPGELCMVGIASFEYSASWARRWLNYGLAKKLLHMIREPAPNEHDLLLPDGKDWLASWWNNIRSLPLQTLTTLLPGATALSEFHKRVNTSPLQGIRLSDAPRALNDFCQDISSRYINSSARDSSARGDQSTTLRYALQQVERGISSVKQLYGYKKNGDTREISTGSDALSTLHTLQKEANLFSVSLFKGATGALPRALSQLSELEGRIETGEIGRSSRHLLDLSHMHRRFEEQGRTAQRQLAIQTWPFPIVGRVLRSTALSIGLVVLVALLIWSIQNSLSFLPTILTTSVPQPGGFSLFRLLIVLVLIMVELFYLSQRNKTLRAHCDNAFSLLRQTALDDLNKVQQAISAQIALHFLQEAGLYHPQGKAGQYKQKLRALDKELKEIQETVIFHHEDAYERLQLGSALTGRTIRPQSRLKSQTRADLLPREQIIETFQRLEEDFIGQNSNLDLLAESLLRQLTGENAYSTSSLLQESFSVEKRYQVISTELMATLLVAQIASSHLITLHPLLERYLSLEQSHPDASSPSGSPFGENIAELYEAIRVKKLEQVMSGEGDVSPQEKAFTSFLAQKPIEQLLTTWIESQGLSLYSNTDNNQSAFPASGILPRLQEVRMSIPEALENLRKRCKLLGYRDELDDGSDAYMLLMPGMADHELQETLTALQSNQIRLLSFPDEEKLIYLHTHRMQIPL